MVQTGIEVEDGKTAVRKIVLFIAISLDGYIADSNGDVDWLGGERSEENDMVTYQEFIKDIDTVIMGATTYRQLVTELSPDEWMYPDFTSYIITHHPEQSTDRIRFTDESPSQLVSRLRREQGKDIWVCGGASIVRHLVQSNLIDKYYINVMPTILGGGIRLFDTAKREIKLKLIQTKSYNGITDLVYERR